MSRASQRRAFLPVRVVEVELSAPLPPLSTERSAGGVYGSALVVVRLHGEPLGWVQIHLTASGVDPSALAAEIDAVCRERIEEHLASDGLSAPAALAAAGIPADEEPVCAAEREAFLGDAPRLSVIIPSRDRPERLEACLSSIYRCRYPRDRFEVVVADNAPSTQETRDLVARLRPSMPSLRYVREDRSGSASARNTGLETVVADITVFTDDDVIVDEHWLAEIARAFQGAERPDCVSGLLLPGELETPAQVWFEQYGGFSRGFAKRVFDLGPHRGDGPLYPYTAGIFGTGNNMAFRTACLREIGGFDPALGNGTPALGGVDSEVLLRTVLEGRRIVYQPTAIAYHVHRPDYAGLRRQVYSYGAGLSAYMLKTLIARPRLIPDFLGRLPRGLRFAFDPRSEKNAGKRSDYPRELTLLEIRGMLYGPLAYARSRRKYGRHPRPDTSRREHMAPPAGHVHV